MLLKTHYQAKTTRKHKQAFWAFGYQPRFQHPRFRCGFGLKAGRCSAGNRTVFSKATQSCTAVYRITAQQPIVYHRLSLLTQFSPGRNQVAITALLTHSSGAWFSTPVRAGMRLFGYLRIAPSKATLHQARLAQAHWWWQLRQLDPLTKVSGLLTLRGRPQACALGSVATVLAPVLWLEWALILLPSGRLHFLSADSAAGLGSHETHRARLAGGTRAGFWRCRGWAPVVRGTAMNPNDHPHGGRTRAIRYPRTPWGRTAKKSRQPRTNVALKPLAKRGRRLLYASNDEPSTAVASQPNALATP